MVRRWLVLAALVIFSNYRNVMAARGNAAKADVLIDIPVGSARFFYQPDAMQRIVVAEPKIVTASPMGKNAFVVTAKGPGESEVLIWLRNGRVVTYRFVATLPLQAIQTALGEAFPDEPDLRIRASGKILYLTGRVANSLTAESAQRMVKEELSESNIKADVVNLLQIMTIDQVQVHLRFVEIARSSLRDMGFNAWYGSMTLGAGLFGTGTPSALPSPFTGPPFPAAAVPTTQTPPSTSQLPMLNPLGSTFAFAVSSAINAIPISATLSMLEQRGVAKTLSEPTLVASNGQEASFLVGGQFPIPMPSALGLASITYKSYGSQLNFTPTILTKDTVQLKIEAVVSALDPANGVTLAGTSVPALQTRSSATSVRLRDGQSFALAGLLGETIQATVQKIPILGDIPGLGLLFRNINHSRTETELMVVASIRLVSPLLESEAPPLFPFEEYNDPNDAELYLLGWIENTKDPKSAKPAGKPPAKPAGSNNHADQKPSPTSKRDFSGSIGFGR